MSANLDIQLSEQVLSALSNAAVALGKTPSELASAAIESVYGSSRHAPPDAETARTRFEECLGSVDLGHPIGIANEAIDA